MTTDTDLDALREELFDLYDAYVTAENHFRQTANDVDAGRATYQQETEARDAAWTAQRALHARINNIGR